MSLRKFTRSRSLFLILTLACSLEGQETAEASLWESIEKPGQTDETSRKLIDLNQKARGGLDALDKVRNVRFTGTLVEGQSDYRHTSLHARPDLLRQEVFRTHIGRDYQTVTGTSGEKTWRRVLLPEKKLPQEISGFEAQLIDLDARIPFLLLDHDANGVVFAYRGEVTYSGRKAYLIHGWLPSGMELDIHIDASSFHVLNYRHGFRIAGRPVLVDRTPTGLKKNDGVWWETGYRFHIRGKVFRQITIEGIAINQDIGEAVFTLPVAREYWLRL